ncbi:MAG: hypothetical protein AAF236_13660 [Verrucomicrobiota bacterium]
MRRLFALLFLTCGLTNLLAEETRTWTSADGRTLEASMVEATEQNVTLRLSNGQRFTLTLDKLSDADQEFIRATLADAARVDGLDSEPWSSRLEAEWVKIPIEEHGLVFQSFASSALKRESNQPFPLWIHLHGAGGRAVDVETGKVEIMAQKLALPENYDEHPCLIIAPLCPPDTYWGSHTQKLEKLIDHLTASLPVDRNRIYLSGYSMGARGIGSLLESRPKSYAAAMFADGDAKAEWVETVEAAVWFWFSGERNLEGARSVAEAFQAAGKIAHFEGFPDFTHNQIHWKLAHDEEVYPWMFSQVRD